MPFKIPSAGLNGKPDFLFGDAMRRDLKASRCYLVHKFVLGKGKEGQATRKEYRPSNKTPVHRDLSRSLHEDPSRRRVYLSAVPV